MTILIPTDFSKPAKVAVLYAVNLGKKLKAKIILLAVISVNTSSASSLKWAKLTDEMIRAASEDAEQLLVEVNSQIKGKVDISYQYVNGYPVEDVVEEFALRNGVDLIVMGTKGATGLNKVLLGTNAVAVINNSSVPVIVVPGENELKTIKKIVYASDMTNVEEEIKTLAMFASIFNASIRILHVIPSNSVKKIAIKKTVATLIKEAKYSKISLHVASNDNISDAVDGFVTEQKADLLALFTHQLDFYEKLFGRSVTRQLAFHARVPMLTFNKLTFNKRCYESVSIQFQ